MVSIAILSVVEPPKKLGLASKNSARDIVFWSKVTSPSIIFDRHDVIAALSKIPTYFLANIFFVFFLRNSLCKSCLNLANKNVSKCP
jgi:hypothetical protein